MPWAPARYDAYLDQMHEWAEDLRVEPDAVELAIFQDVRDQRQPMVPSKAIGELVPCSKLRIESVSSAPLFRDNVTSHGSAVPSASE